MGKKIQADFLRLLTSYKSLIRYFANCKCTCLIEHTTYKAYTRFYVSSTFSFGTFKVLVYSRVLYCYLLFQFNLSGQISLLSCFQIWERYMSVDKTSSSNALIKCVSLFQKYFSQLTLISFCYIAKGVYMFVITKTLV